MNNEISEKSRDKFSKEKEMNPAAFLCERGDMNMEIPKTISLITEKLEQRGFKAYIVGGCVRDILMRRKPKDWDITTDALPLQIQKIFSGSFYENRFGTVGVKTGAEDETLKVVEITTFRTEEKYSDQRHPDRIEFAKTIEEDLKRRDFTINAMAIRFSNGNRIKSNESRIFEKNSRDSIRKTLEKYEIIDLFNGQEDLKNKIIRAVGNPEKRFNEDALRMIRAVRFAAELNFNIDAKTTASISKNAALLEKISSERKRDEFIKIIDSDNPAFGIELLRNLGILKFIIPELELGVGVSQNKYHIYNIYEHSLHSLKAAGEQRFGRETRIAALLHDIAKPQTKAGEGPDATFYNHDQVGAKISQKILDRLRFPVKEKEKIITLVKNHMFISDPEKITEAGVRRLIRRAGPENIPDLINLRISDRLGMMIQDAGLKARQPKARPYRLRKLEYLIEKVSRDPISAQMLKINGQDIMETLRIEPGPKIGALLNILLAEVIEDPKRNEKEYLIKRVKELNKENLDDLKERAKEKIDEKKEEEDLKIKGKYWVK